MSASTTDGPGLGRAGPARRGIDGALVLALTLAAAAPAFWFGLTALAGAWSVPEYSHGPIIPLISLFLFLREMRAVPPTAAPVRDRWPGVAVMAVGLAFSVLGHLVQVDDLVMYSLIIWLAGLTLTAFGMRRGVLFWPAILHLVFMLPLPQAVYWQVSTQLQFVSSEIGVWLVALAGVPVILDGNIIDLGIYKLQVAEACSGLRYLFPMLSFSYVFAVLYQGPKWHKVLLLLSAAPITVLMNSFRIGMIGVLVNSYGIEHAEGFLHSFEGWVIFVACVVILFGLVKLLQLASRDRRSLSEALDIEFEGLGGQLARARRVVPSTALLTAAMLSAAVSLGLTAIPERTPETLARTPLVIFPNALGAWRGGMAVTLDPLIERTLAADDYHGVDFTAPGHDAPVNLFMAYYLDQNDGTGIHSPEACIPAGGWEVSDWSTVRFVTDGGGAVEANRAIIQKGVQRQLVYFWFELRGERVANSYRAKFLNLRDAVLKGRSDGALVRVITPIAPSAPVADADARLRAFISGLLPALPPFIPR